MSTGAGEFPRQRLNARYHEGLVTAMKERLVTVAIPTYNRPEFLCQALESVLAQDMPDFEILVTDDASQCDVAALAASFGDPRIRVVRHPRNIGMVQNMRASLCMPNTRYVAHLDDDDLWLPHHLREAVAALETHPDATFYSCAAERFGTRGGVFKPGWCNSGGIEVSRWQDTGYGVWLAGCPVQSSSVVLRRDALEGIFWGGRSWPWCNDWLWWGQLALRGAFLFNATVGVKYRWHASNESSHMMNSRGKAHWLFTVRELAKRAWAAGALRDLAAEVRDFPASAVCAVVIALTAPGSPPGLARQARAILESRRDILTQVGCARNYRIAAAMGTWWLRYADVSTRLRGRWWPVPAW